MHIRGLDTAAGRLWMPYMSVSPTATDPYIKARFSVHKGARPCYKTFFKISPTLLRIQILPLPTETVVQTEGGMCIECSSCKTQGRRAVEN